MKKSFLLCLLMTLFTTWAVQAQSTIFFSEDFEGGSMPSGWTADGPGAWSVGQGDYYTTTGAGEGSYNARITHTVTGYVTKLITPAIDLSAASSAELSFMHIQRAWAGDYDFLAVYYRSKESEDWTLLADYSDAAAATWTQEDGIALPDLSDTYQIAFEFTDNYGYGLGIDMVQIMKAAACPKVSGLTISNITTTSAALSWDAIGNASAWNFIGSTDSDFPDDASKTFSLPFPLPASQVPNNTVDLADYSFLFTLQPNTTYYVKLQAICGTDGTGDWSNTASFHTACEAFALPFFDGFEDGIYCWTMVDCASGTGIYSTSSTSSYCYSGTQSFKFAYNTNPPQYLISPELEPIDKNIIVDFYYKVGGGYTESFKIGYSTTTNAISDFTWGEEVFVDNTEWDNYLETLPQGVKYVAIQYTANDQLSLYIDEFNVYAEPDCPKPTSLAVSNITAHNATFTWTSDADAWQLCINDGGDDEYYNVSANPFTISADLKAETEYTAKLRTLCEGDAHSDWSNEVTFTTDIACPAPTFGAEAVSNLGATEATIAWDGNGEDYTLSYRKARYVDGLEETFGTSIPTGWTMYTGLYNEEEGTATLTASTYGWSFGNSNGVFDNHARVNIYGNYQRWLVTPQFVLEGSSLEFDLALTAYSGTLADPQTTGTDDKFLVLLSEDKENWKVLAQWDNVGTEFSYNDIDHTASGQHISLDLSDYEGSNIYIAFYGESTVSNADNNLHIDNVICGTVHEPTAWISESGITEKSKQITGLEPETKYDVKVQSNCGSDGMSQESEIISFTTTPTCVVPANLTASDITAHTATFSWNGESDYGWQLCINDGGDDEIILATTNPFTVADLKPETEYTAKLRTLCEDDVHSDWSNTVTFTTDVACPAPTNLEAELTPGNGKVASLRWAAGSAEDWILQYSESAAFEPAQEITVNGNSFYDLDDLTPETTYFARVKALCGDEDGDSQWSEPISFTPTDAYSITINEGTATNTVVPIQGVWVDNLTRSQFIIPASDLASIAYANITQLTFYAEVANVNEWFAVAEFEVYVAEVSETTLSELADWASMEKVLSGAHLAVVDHQMVVTFDDPYQYMGGNLMIGFYQTVSGTYKTATWYGISATGASYGGHEGSLNQQNFLPQMTINYIPGEAPTCFKPTNLQVMGIDNHNAYLSWVSDAGAWHLCLDGDEENFITRTDPMYAWNGLEANTEHSFKVRSVCGDQVTAWSQEVTFTTLCDPITDLYEFFETYTDWELPACWHGIYESTYPTVAIGYSAYAYSGSNFLYFYSVSDASTDQYAILPNIESLDGKRIKFYARKQEATWEDVTMTVGVMTDPSNENTFVALESFTLTSAEYDLYNVSFADYTGEGKFIAIKMDAAETNYAAMIIDDIIINNMPSCLEPSGLTVTEITGESATLTWESDAEAWEVYLEGPEEDAEIVYEKSYTFTGLDPMTQYTAVVHAICSEEDSSEGPYINFTTDCGVATLPFFEGFEGNIDCWTLDANGSSSGLKNTAYEGNMSFAFSYPYYPQYLISPELEVTDNDVNVEFYYAIQSASYPETFQVGYSTSSNNVEDDSWVWSDEIEATNVFSDHWEVYTATLPAGAKYFGIKYNSDDMFYLFIDNISIEEIEPQDECEAQALPFYEDFEENSETRECWTTVAAAEDTEWAWDDQNNHFFRFYFGDEPQYLISPELVPEDMNARIAFDYKCENAQLSEAFKLGYSYYGNSLGEFEWTDELLAEDDQNWTQFACIVPGGVTYIAIQYTSIDQYGLQIDNVSVEMTDKATDVEAVKNDAKVYKFVKDGALFILHNGKLFNAQGKFVK